MKKDKSLCNNYNKNKFYKQNIFNLYNNIDSELKKDIIFIGMNRLYKLKRKRNKIKWYDYKGFNLIIIFNYMIYLSIFIYIFLLLLFYNIFSFTKINFINFEKWMIKKFIPFDSFVSIFYKCSF